MSIVLAVLLTIAVLWVSLVLVRWFIGLWRIGSAMLTYRLAFDESSAREFGAKAATDPKWADVVVMEDPAVKQAP